MSLGLDKQSRLGYTPDMNIKEYLSQIGRKGGSAKSERKTHASRENGRKGGRPKRMHQKQTEKQSGLRDYKTKKGNLSRT